jgi:hypothetical protein
VEGALRDASPTAAAQGRRDRPHPEDDYVEIDAAELAGVFAAPRWLRDVGVTVGAG